MFLLLPSPLFEPMPRTCAPLPLIALISDRSGSWHPDPVLLHKQQAAAGWSLTRLKEKQEFKHPRAGTMMDFYVRVWRPFGQASSQPSAPNPLGPYTTPAT
eukprot:3435573-Rhodomonas_salina.4